MIRTKKIFGPCKNDSMDYYVDFIIENDNYKVNHEVNKSDSNIFKKILQKLFKNTSKVI